jgi:hypothetical protein
MSEDESVIVEYDTEYELLDKKGYYFQINCASVPKNKLRLLIEFLKLLEEQSNTNDSLITDDKD